MRVVLIAAAIAARRADPNDPLDVLAKLGGLEIAAMAGAYLGAAAARTPSTAETSATTSARTFVAVGCPE